VTDPPGRPAIRTFHPRRSRIGVTASDAMARMWPRFGIDVDADTRIDPEEWYARRAPLVLEIGSGMGEATIAMATARPDRDFLAVEVHTPGLGAILRHVERAGLTNLRVARGDAVELLEYGLAPGTLDAICVFFPDPWPKARHHKRRIIRPEIVALMRERLRPRGTLHCATDWADYAEQMIEVLAADPGLRPAGPGYRERPESRPVTRFEQRGLDEGRTIADFCFARI
jgi:tRNA (guanine-N7-)-methyltransferase